MPIYEFVCRKCKNVFEYLTRAEDKPKCPVCESTKVEKMFSATATRVRGSGVDCPVEADCSARKSCCGAGRCAHNH